MRTVLATALFFAAPIVAQAADISSTGSTLTFQGPVVMGDALRFHMNLMAAERIGTPIRTVRLNSPGGLVNEAEQIARDIQQAKINTAVVPNGMCASACFLPFAAGKAKVVGDYAVVGVHSASVGAAHTDDELTTAQMARFAGALGVPNQILGRMKIQTGTQISWLSAVELQSMGASVATVNVVNDWQMPGAEKYDAKASANEKAFMSKRDEADAAQKEAMARFEANPLHKAIMGY